MTQNRLVSRTLGGALGAALLVVSLGGLSACKKKEVARSPMPAPSPTTYNPPVATAPAGVQFRELRVGKAINADKSVSTDIETFAPSDTIYASVATTGAAAAIPIRAVWTFQDGQVVSDDTQTIAAAGSDMTEFHISKPDGFPPGSYKVEIFIDGRSAMNRSFNVR